MPQHPPLTHLEREVLQLLSHGKTAWEIGKILDLHQRSVEWRVAQILKKLEAPNSTAAVAKALRTGLLNSNNK